MKKLCAISVRDDAILLLVSVHGAMPRYAQCVKIFFASVTVAVFVFVHFIPQSPSDWSPAFAGVTVVGGLTPVCFVVH
jgi:hypothetical protein